MHDTLLYNPQTKRHVAQFIETPSHALLLVGPTGSGKTHLATAIACSVLGQTFAGIASYPYFTIISPEEKGGAISIEVIRGLQHDVRLKTLGDNPLRRVFIVEHADKLTVEAQNALLKLLEEPPADTVLILTAASKRLLLPTITSRLQTVNIHAPSEEDIRAYFQRARQAGSGDHPGGIF